MLDPSVLDKDSLAGARRKAGLFFSTFGSHDSTPISFIDSDHEFKLGPDLEPVDILPRREMP